MAADRRFNFFDFFAAGDRVRVHNPDPGRTGTVIGPDLRSLTPRIVVHFDGDPDGHRSRPLAELLRPIG